MLRTNWFGWMPGLSREPRTCDEERVGAMEDWEQADRPLLPGLLEATYGPWEGGSRTFRFHTATPMRRAVDVSGTQYKDGRITYEFELSDKLYGSFMIPSADDARSIASALWMAADALDRFTGRAD